MWLLAGLLRACRGTPLALKCLKLHTTTLDNIQML